MREFAYEPLRVRAYLQCGVISDPFLPLDAVVYYLVHREEIGEHVATLPGESSVAGDGGSRKRMPFRRAHKSRRHWHWRCSFAQWPEHTTQGKDYWSSRFDVQYSDLIDFGGRRGTIPISSGRYKAHRVPVFYRHALYVDWYCVADRAELERLLRFATHLGKKPAQGWGAVLRWELTPWPEDWSVTGPGGKLMRAVYDPHGRDRYGIRPAYWLPENQFPCTLPAYSL